MNKRDQKIYKEAESLANRMLELLHKSKCSPEAGMYSIAIMIAAVENAQPEQHRDKFFPLIADSVAELRIELFNPETKRTTVQ
jgi:hypothetical protein